MQIFNNIMKILYENKAENIVVYKNVRNEETSYIVSSCLSDKHVKSVAYYLIQEIKFCDSSYEVEGLNQGNWVLVNLEGDIYIHIFRSSVRKYYEVDILWESLAAVTEPYGGEKYVDNEI